MVATWWASSYELVLGFVLGIAASFVAWWVAVRAFVPRLLISEINRLEDPASRTGVRYRLKVRNPSRRRLVAGLEIHARLLMRGLKPDLPANLTTFDIPLGSTPTFPVVEAHDERMYTLQLGKLQKHPKTPLLPENVRARIDTIGLEELLEQGTEAFLRIVVSGAHELSGNRRTYTRTFRIPNIHEGMFERGSIEIVPRDDGDARGVESDAEDAQS